MKREDDFESRRKHLAGLTDEELDKRFWELCDNIVEPLIKMAENHTTPAVERSVLLRMGFSSLEAKGIVDRVMNLGLIGKGAGNVVYRLSKRDNSHIRDAGLKVMNGRYSDSEITGLFKGAEI